MEVTEILHTEVGPMAPRGGPGRGQGRRAKPGYHRHNIIVKDATWKWLLDQAKFDLTAGGAVDKLVEEKQGTEQEKRENAN